MSERDELSGHAFISYAHANSREVDQLQQTLEAAGIRVWRDTDDLWPGEDWQAKIREVITHNALAFIACFSKQSVGRTTSYQNEELTLATEEMRRRSPGLPWLIPVRFDDCDIPDRDIGGGRTLSSIHRVDLFGPNAKTGAERLAAAVLRILDRESYLPENTESSALDAEQAMPSLRDTRPAARLSQVPPDGPDLSVPHVDLTRQVVPGAKKPGSPREDARPLQDSWLGSTGTLKLYQPVLFVGLGGSGCDIGAALERRLRQEFCGPDGEEFMRRFPSGGLSPYQLPSCVQFVYADICQEELDQMPRRVVPSSAHIPAVLETAHYSRALAPWVDTYSVLARNLRLEELRCVEHWLPPADDEPVVSPLSNGAAQFPTVGRAALFGTFLKSIAPAVRDIDEAIGKLATSGVDLHALGGNPIRGIDVFVAFSVAGGTGGGIFYDYLHLIAAELWQNRLRAKIYPLVLMPSAFEDGLGGGRAAELNAGRALLDLFHLVDQQNDAGPESRRHGMDDRMPVTREEVAVSYPGDVRFVIPPGTVQTGFLFSRPTGVAREDVHQSIVSLVTSLVGTEISEDDNQSGELHHSFADSFVEEAVPRDVRADDGLGNRGVSTALVASLTSPFNYLAGLISGRLLREAIKQLSSLDGKEESNREHSDRFLAAAGVEFLNFSLAGQRIPFDEPQPAQGARKVSGALNDRAEAMQRSIDTLKATRARSDAKMFNPQAGIKDLLTRLDVFHAQRVAFGHASFDDHVDRAGAAGRLRDRKTAPAAPDGCDDNPPVIPKFTDKLGRRQLRWTDSAPAQVRQSQDAWYQWQTQVAWTRAWRESAPVWQHRMAQTQQDLLFLTKAFIEFAHSDETQFGRQAAELYRTRTGVTYLLPFGNIDIEQLYVLVMNRLLANLAIEADLQSAAPEASLVDALIVAHDGWREAYETSLSSGPEQAVTYVRDLVKAEVKACLRSAADGNSPPLPRLHDLVAEAAGHRGGKISLREYVEEFRQKLAKLVPPRFVPQGEGIVKVLISYPADARSLKIEAYLRETINLPRGPYVVYYMRNVAAESITVVMLRTSMGLTDVAEVRDVLGVWSRAQTRPEPGDLLHWRQRTGYESGYLASTEEHRVEILHRLLCALWNGKVKAEGDLKSPDRITVELNAAATLSLQLQPLEHASSWGSLVRAYELRALDGDDARHLICARLLREMPEGLDTRPRPPDRLYLMVRDTIQDQIEYLFGVMKRQEASQRSLAAQMWEFWTELLPAALDKEFTGIYTPAAPNLRELEAVVSPKNGG